MLWKQSGRVKQQNLEHGSICSGLTLHIYKLASANQPSMTHWHINLFKGVYDISESTLRTVFGANSVV